MLKNEALSKKLAVSALKDGVVAFQRVQDADLYATLLAEDGTSNVRLSNNPSMLVPQLAQCLLCIDIVAES